MMIATVVQMMVVGSTTVSYPVFMQCSSMQDPSEASVC
jgi:hypothetical protein